MAKTKPTAAEVESLRKFILAVDSFYAQSVAAWVKPVPDRESNIKIMRDALGVIDKETDCIEMVKAVFDWPRDEAWRGWAVSLDLNCSKLLDELQDKRYREDRVAVILDGITSRRRELHRIWDKLHARHGRLTKKCWAVDSMPAIEDRPIYLGAGRISLRGKMLPRFEPESGHVQLIEFLLSRNGERVKGGEAQRSGNRNVRNASKLLKEIANRGGEGCLEPWIIFSGKSKKGYQIDFIDGRQNH